MLTVQRVYELIDALAPFDTQADFDNSGLLVGNPQAEVTGIHLALDVTDCVIDDALAAGREPDCDASSPDVFPPGSA